MGIFVGRLLPCHPFRWGLSHRQDYLSPYTRLSCRRPNPALTYARRCNHKVLTTPTACFHRNIGRELLISCTPHTSGISLMGWAGLGLLYGPERRLGSSGGCDGTPPSARMLGCTEDWLCQNIYGAAAACSRLAGRRSTFTCADIAAAPVSFLAVKYGICSSTVDRHMRNHSGYGRVNAMTCRHLL